MIDPETEHLLTRAHEEAVLAIQATHPAAARAHQGLAVRYSTKAAIGLAQDESGSGPLPRPVPSVGANLPSRFRRS